MKKQSGGGGLEERMGGEGVAVLVTLLCFFSHGGNLVYRGGRGF